MLNRLKSKIKLIIKDGVGWSGDYASWQLAKQQCVGYDAANILEKVKNAVLKVKNGEAVHERDSVLFDEIRYSYPLLVTILWEALKNNNRLNVIDFGGSLGSSYFQNKKYLDDIKDMQWRVVEQPAFVEAGRKYIQDKKISFYNSLEEAQLNYRPDLLVISCAIQYMEKPYELIEKIIQFNIPHIIIDNTPFNFEYRDRLTVQKVPPSIYTASYPCWFLNIDKVIEAFCKKYVLVSQHFNDDFIELDGDPVPYQGFVLELQNRT